MIDAKRAVLTRAAVSQVEPLSKRGSRARKAVLFVKLTIRPVEPAAQEAESSRKEMSIVCVLGGDQTNCWAQRLRVHLCDVPPERMRRLFEVYNRYRDEYTRIEAGDENLFYLGLDNLEDEVLFARAKMKAEMKPGLRCDRGEEAQPLDDFEEPESFREYALKLAKREGARYGDLVEYLDRAAQDFDFANYGDMEYMIHALARGTETYYWLDQTRVSEETWCEETDGGFNHWYDVAEVYSLESPLPFDLNDERIVSIFGFGRFEAFADLSYGC